jgi:uncharacterized UBP type Zn finger protein
VSETQEATIVKAESTVLTQANPIDMMEIEQELEGAGDEEEREALRAALLMSMSEDVDSVPVTLTPATATIVKESTPSTSGFLNEQSGLPADFTGHYELHSIVTHKGRSADSGHYIGWTRQGPGSRYWWKFDDDVVTEVDSEEIMRLKGGGDKDMTYLVFYRYKASSE